MKDFRKQSRLCDCMWSCSHQKEESCSFTRAYHFYSLILFIFYLIFTFVGTLAPSVLRDCFSVGHGKRLKKLQAKYKNRFPFNFRLKVARGRMPVLLHSRADSSL